jgi:hypothetical protein
MLKKIVLIVAVILPSVFLMADRFSIVERQWEKTKFIWNFAIAISCDVMPVENPANYFNMIARGRQPRFQPRLYRDIKKGDTVWLQSRFLPKFCRSVLPFVKDPFVLVMNDGDETFPSDILNKTELEELVNDDRIIAIFSQNSDYQGPSPKVHQMPIGIDFHTIAYAGTKGRWGLNTSSPSDQEKSLNQLIARLKPPKMRKKRAFVDFQHHDTLNYRYMKGQNPENRIQIFKQVCNSGLVDFTNSPLNRNELWKTKGEYAFSVSPHGRGLDCHRTWEDLALGCIVIVKSSPLDPMYEGLPVVIVNDWSEINEENFDLWLEQFGDTLSNPAYRERLTTDYWWKKIEEAARTYKD